MASWRWVTAGVLIAAAAVSACDKAAEATGGKTAVAVAPPREASDPVTTAARAALTPQEQAGLAQLQAGAAKRLEADLASARADPDGSRQIAGFVGQNERQISQLVQRIESQTEAMRRMKDKADGPDDPSMRSPSRQIFAAAIAELTARRAIHKTALASDPLVARAYAEWAGGDKAASITDITRKFIEQPCLSDQSAVPAFSARYAFRGVSVGMTEAQALKGACAANKDDVKIVRYSTSRTHPPKFSNQADYVHAAAALGQPYRGGMVLCLGCLADSGAGPGEGRSELQIEFLPTGLVSKVGRAEAFGEGGVSSASNGRVPRALKTLLEPLQAQFGPPSFTYNDREATMVGWRYVGGASAPSPLEPWYVTQTTNNHVLQYKDDGLIYSGGAFSEAALRKVNPQTSYCMSGPFDNRGPRLWKKYFSINNEQVLIKSRVQGKSYDQIQADIRAYTPPGQTNDCGVLVFATFFKTQDEVNRTGMVPAGGRSFKVIDGEVPIAKVDLSMVEASAAYRQRVLEDQQIEDYIKSAKAQVQHQAEKPSAAFAP